MADIPQPPSTEAKLVLDAIAEVNRKLDAILAGQADAKKLADARYTEAQAAMAKAKKLFNPFGK